MLHVSAKPDPQNDTMTFTTSSRYPDGSFTNLPKATALPLRLANG